MLGSSGWNLSLCWGWFPILRMQLSLAQKPELHFPSLLCSNNATMESKSTHQTHLFWICLEASDGESRPCSESFWQGGRQTHPVRSCSHRGSVVHSSAWLGWRPRGVGGREAVRASPELDCSAAGALFLAASFQSFISAPPLVTFSCLVLFKVKSFYCWMDFFVLKELKDLLSGLNAFKQIFFSFKDEKINSLSWITKSMLS